MIATASLSTLLIKYNPEKYNRILVNKQLHMKLFLMSILFMTNIVYANAGIEYCSLAFVQMVRCGIPIITAALNSIILHRPEPLRIWLSLIPVVIGSVLLTIGDISLTVYGFFITILACFLSALKGVLTKKFLSGDNKIPVFQMLEFVYLFNLNR